MNYFNGIETLQTEALESLLGEEMIVIGDIILTEVLQGFRSNREFNRAKQLMSSFPVYTLLGRENAIIAARNYRKMRNRGLTVRKTVDVIIGTFCIENGIPLLHSDRDFEPMVALLGLEVV